MGANRVDYRKYVKDFILEFRTLDQELAAAHDRMREIDELCRIAAEQIYRAKAIYRGDTHLALPWDALTPGQRQAYVAELQDLVTEWGERHV